MQNTIRQVTRIALASRQITPLSAFSAKNGQSKGAENVLTRWTVCLACLTRSAPGLSCLALSIGLFHSVRMIRCTAFTLRSLDPTLNSLAKGWGNPVGLKVVEWVDTYLS